MGRPARGVRLRVSVREKEVGRRGTLCPWVLRWCRPAAAVVRRGAAFLRQGAALCFSPFCCPPFFPLEVSHDGCVSRSTGLLAGAAVGVLFGSHVSDPFICAAVGAGAALLPDLDERVDGGAFFGVVTEGVSRV